MAEVVSVGEKGQIVIPKRFREDLHMDKNSKLLVAEEKGRLIIKKIVLDEDSLWMLAGEETLKKTWGNPHDERWDDVL